MELLLNLPTTVVVCIQHFWRRSIGTSKPGNEASRHAPVAPLRLSCHHHCRHELAPLVQHTGDVLHGALAIAIYLLEDLWKQSRTFMVFINSLSVPYHHKYFIHTFLVPSMHRISAVTLRSWCLYMGIFSISMIRWARLRTRTDGRGDGAMGGV